jgi:hypothetical protein
MKYKIEFNENINEYTIPQLINIIKKNPNIIYYKYIDNNKIQINNNFVIKSQFISHRINKIDELKNLDNIFGLECDVRDDHNSNELILAHDPFVKGDNLESFLKEYNHKTLIFNIKSERVELKCLELIQKYNITDYFFLDSSFPMIYLLNKKYNNSNISSRYSEYEPLSFTENIKDLIKWIWIDCFTKLPLDTNIYQNIKKINKKICIVSPELQGQPEKINEYRDQLINNNIVPDAICCKEYNIILWI